MVKDILFQRYFRTISIIVLSLLWVGFFADSANSDENNPHTGISCLNCHSMSDNIDIKRENCISCHNTIEENSYLELLNFHKDNSRQCTDCHTFHDTKYLHIDSVKFQFDFNLESSKATCFACHLSDGSLSNLSDGHQEARKLYHSDLVEENEMTPSQTCMACHASTTNDFDLEFINTKMPVINNHASHPYEIEIVRGKGNSTNRIKFEIEPGINIFSNRIECQTCHSLTTENKYLVVNSENQSNFCTGCHEHNSNSIDLVSTP